MSKYEINGKHGPIIGGFVAGSCKLSVGFEGLA